MQPDASAPTAAKSQPGRGRLWIVAVSYLLFFALLTYVIYQKRSAFAALGWDNAGGFLLVILLALALVFTGLSLLQDPVARLAGLYQGRIAIASVRPLDQTLGSLSQGMPVTQGVTVTHGVPRPAAGTMMSVPAWSARTGAAVATRASTTVVMIRRRIKASLSPFVKIFRQHNNIIKIDPRCDPY